MSSREEDIALLKSVAAAAFPQPTRRRSFFGTKPAAGPVGKKPAPDAFVVQDILKDPRVIRAALEKATPVFSPFGDALASAGDVGRVDINISIAVKRGDESVRQQCDMMNAYPDLFPPSYCQSNEGFEFVYMKLVSAQPLHNEVFLAPFPNVPLIEEASRRLWDMVAPHYVKVSGEAGSLRWHHETRVLPGLAAGIAGLEARAWATGDIDASRLTQVILDLNGHALPPVVELLAFAEPRLERYPPCTVGFCHGDLHLSNVLVHRDGMVEFIDPSPKWSPGDYVWDFARYLMWLELFGFIAIQRRGDGTAGLDVTVDDVDGTLRVGMRLDRKDLRDRVSAIARERLASVASQLDDHDYRIRLEYILASAYFSMMDKLVDRDDPANTNASHLLLCYSHGIRHLAMFQELAVRAA